MSPSVQYDNYLTKLCRNLDFLITHFAQQIKPNKTVTKVHPGQISMQDHLSSNTKEWTVLTLIQLALLCGTEFKMTNDSLFLAHPSTSTSGKLDGFRLFTLSHLFGHTALLWKASATNFILNEILQMTNTQLEQRLFPKAFLSLTLERKPPLCKPPSVCF